MRTPDVCRSLESHEVFRLLIWNYEPAFAVATWWGFWNLVSLVVCCLVAWWHSHLLWLAGIIRDSRWSQSHRQYRLTRACLSFSSESASSTFSGLGGISGGKLWRLLHWCTSCSLLGIFFRGQWQHGWSWPARDLLKVAWPAHISLLCRLRSVQSCTRSASSWTITTIQGSCP